MRLKYFFIIIFTFIINFGLAQNLYKTPSGKHYHLGSCNIVKNVERRIKLSETNNYNLLPCKICHPNSTFSRLYTSKNIEQGKSDKKRCIGKTKKGIRCKHYTRIGNGYCFQHKSINTN